MQSIILIFHVIAALCMIALVLMQQGKGAEAGAGFGAGASGTVFGSQGSTPFLVKITAVLALIFFATSLSLDYLAAHRSAPVANAQVESILGKTLPATPVKSGATLSVPRHRAPEKSGTKQQSHHSQAAHKKQSVVKAGSKTDEKRR